MAAHRHAYLRELPAHASIAVTERVGLRGDAGAALCRMGPWARHDLTPRPLATVTVAVELSVYRPRPG